MSNISFSEALGKRALIIGDVGTGKTALTRRLLVEAVDKGYAHSITVMEMAPRATTIRGLSVGGMLINPTNWKVHHLGAEDIRTPRLSAKNGEDLLKLADNNKNEIEKMLDEFTTNPTSILFVNDVSIYLQRGDLDRLWSTLEKADTVVANGYAGEKLKDDFGTGISARERRLMEKLAARMEVVICL